MKLNEIKVSTDFTNFPARAYLEEYFSSNGQENQALLTFLHQTYKNLPRQGSLIEVGGGPTIYQLIGASEKVDFIIFSEFARSCREEIRKFLEGNKKAFNWDVFIQYVIELDGREPSRSRIESVKERIRSKVKAVIPCDVRKKAPLSPAWLPQFDVLSMHSVADAISSNEKEFIQNIENPLTLLKPGGYFIGMFVKNSKIWKCGNIWYPSFPVDEQYIRGLFPKLNLSLDNMSTVEAELDQGYDGLISFLATKKK